VPAQIIEHVKIKVALQRWHMLIERPIGVAASKHTRPPGL
jgi:hypothetical protein